MAATANQVARAILETMPLLMRSVRADISQHVGGAITVPQLRVLRHLRQGDWCLSDLAAHQRVSLATMSKMISGLVDRGFVVRSYEYQDRRFIKLRLTPNGKRFFDDAYSFSLKRLAERVAVLSSAERDGILACLSRLQPLFEEGEMATPPSPLERGGRGRSQARSRPGKRVSVDQGRVSANGAPLHPEPNRMRGRSAAKVLP